MANTNTRRLLASIAALITACAGLMVAATPAQAAEAEFKVVVHNLGSGHDNDLNGNGVYGGHGSVEDPITRVVNRIQAENPHAALLQEVCEEDVPRMLSQLGTPWIASQFAATQPAKAYPDPNGWNNSCEDRRGRSTGKGNVMLTRLPIFGGTEQSVQQVGYHDGRFITLGCMNVVFGGVLGGRTQVCNTHLSAGRGSDDLAARNSQANNIRAYVNSEAQIVPLVLGGDFNSQPKTAVIDQFHAVKRNGSAFNGNWFYEGDHECGTSLGFCRAGAATHGAHGGNPRKLDHVFFGKKWTKFPASVDLYTRDSATSYHEVITARTKFEW